MGSAETPTVWGLVCPRAICSSVFLLFGQIGFFLFICGMAFLRRAALLTGVCVGRDACSSGKTQTHRHPRTCHHEGHSMLECSSTAF